VTEKLIFSYKKGANTSYFMHIKKTVFIYLFIYFIDRKTIFFIYSLSVSDIPNFLNYM